MKYSRYCQNSTMLKNVLKMMRNTEDYANSHTSLSGLDQNFLFFWMTPKWLLLIQQLKIIKNKRYLANLMYYRRFCRKIVPSKQKKLTSLWCFALQFEVQCSVTFAVHAILVAYFAYIQLNPTLGYPLMKKT